MRSITGNLTKELSDYVHDQPIARADAYPIATFRVLMEFLAKLAYLNKDYLLFFRGQEHDYRNKAGTSSFYPSIYRGERVSRTELDLRFDILSSAARRLCDFMKDIKLEGHHEVRRRKYVQWSILQHYEVCRTPLLDFTHSPRVACSFGFLSSKKSDPYLSVFGLPYMMNRISVNSEHDIVNIRLLSICPPDGLRPYFQDGYLGGTDEITTEYDSKDELDFNNRLIAKFCLRQDQNFWGRGFGAIPKAVLYPSADRLEDICKNIKEELGTDVDPTSLGKFLQKWTDLENLILVLARQRQKKIFSLREAINVLVREEALPFDILDRLNRLRRTRNRAVHEPNRLKPHELLEGLDEISSLRKSAKLLDL